MPRSPGTRRRILSAAVELFAERGYHEASMRDIAAAVRVKPASLYSHFDNKEAILGLIIEEYKEALAALRLPDAELERITGTASAETIFVEGFKVFERAASASLPRKVMRVIFNEMFRNRLVGAFACDSLKKRNLDELTRIFRAMNARGLLRNAAPELLAVLYNALLNSYFQQLFVLENCGRDTSALRRETLRQVRGLARAFSRHGK